MDTTDAIYKEWLSRTESASILCYEIPGSGKSVLTVGKYYGNNKVKDNLRSPDKSPGCLDYLLGQEDL